MTTTDLGSGDIDPAGRVPLERLLAHREFVRALARSLVHDPATADDLEQQAWMAAVEHPPAARGSVRGWFARVLRNAARDRWRGDARREAREAMRPTPPDVPRPDDLAARAEMHRRVVLAVFDLDEPSRRTILLRFFDGLDTDEIARREGVPAATVRKRISRGLATLRDRLDADHGGDRRAWTVALLSCADLLPDDLAVCRVPGERADAEAAPTARRPSRAPEFRVVAAAALLVAVAGTAALLASRGTVPADGRDDAPGRDGDSSAATGVPRRTGRAAGESAPSRGSDDPRGVLAAAATSALASAGDLVVTVVSAEGDRVPGARVIVTAPRGRAGPAGVVFDDTWSGAAPTPLREAAAGPDGTARVERLPTGACVVRAAAPGHAPSASVRVWLTTDPTTVRTRLCRSATVSGRVIDAVTESPLEAEVCVVPEEGNISGGREPVWRGRSGPDGTFVADGVPAGFVRVAARRDGSAWGHAALADTDGHPRVLLRLPPDAIVRAEAIDTATRAPAARAVLEVRIDVGAGGLQPQIREVVADEQGKVEIRGVPVGSSIRFDAAPGGLWRSARDASRPGASAATGVVASSGLDGLVVPLDRGGSLTGRATGPSGDAVAGAEVLLVGDVRSPGHVAVGAVVARTTTAVDGTFRIDGLDPGSFEIAVRGEGLLFTSCLSAASRLALATHPRTDDSRTVVRAGDVTHLDVRLASARRIEGRVLDFAGLPVATARVVTLDRHFGSDVAAETTSRADGTFVLTPVPDDGAPVRVHARAGDATGSAAADGTAPVEIRLAPVPDTTCRVSGIVVGPDGEPVRHVRLVALRDGLRHAAADPRVAFLGYGDPVAVERDGSFDLPPLDARQFRRIGLVATAPGFVTTETGVDLVAGKAVGGVRVVLDTGIVVSGRLLGPDGSPAADVPIRAVLDPLGASARDGLPPTSATRDDGSFQVRVPRGRHIALCLGFAGAEVISVPADPDRTDPVEIRLTADALRFARWRPPEALTIPDPDVRSPDGRVRLAGRVLDARGEAVAGALVRCTRSVGGGRSSSGSQTGADGRFDFPVESGAVLVIEVDAGDRGTARVGNVVASAGETVVRIETPAEPDLRGTVRDEEGRHVGGARITLVRVADDRPPREQFGLDGGGAVWTGTRDRREIRAAADGSFVLPALPRGRWAAWAGGPGTPWTPTGTAAFDTGRGTVTDLVVAAGHTLRLRARDASGRPVAAARVRIVVRLPEGSALPEIEVMATTQGDGLLVVPGLPPGPWRVFGPATPTGGVDVMESERAVDI